MELVMTDKIQVTTSQTKSTLTIKGAEQSDAGLYRCVSVGRGSLSELITECSVYIFGEMIQIPIWCF